MPDTLTTQTPRESAYFKLIPLACSRFSRALDKFQKFWMIADESRVIRKVFTSLVYPSSPKGRTGYDRLKSYPQGTYMVVVG